MNAERTFLLRVAYDGSAFHGWQIQPSVRTVQGELVRAVREVTGETDIRVHGAGRTDTGVHARGQGASFAARTTLPQHAVAPRLQQALPDDIRVRSAEEKPAGFHARHSARWRRYSYHLLDDHDVLMRRSAWYPGHPFDVGQLARAAEPLAGVHDCSAFEAAGSSEVDPVCIVRRAAWERVPGGARFDIVANHFLYHMVRNLVGTSLDAARTRDPGAHMASVLASRSRARGGVTAPPHALCLEQVIYDDEEEA